jgi:hypothetical protein
MSKGKVVRKTPVRRIKIRKLGKVETTGLSSEAG